MKALEKLRESSHPDDCKWTLGSGEVVFMVGGEPDDPKAVNWGEQWRTLADEIEAEIEERYMELPVDADGVPIKVGDEVRIYPTKPADALNTGGLVTSITSTGIYLDRGCIPYQADIFRHVKLRTVEDVLAEFASRQHGITTEENAELIARYADELREIMGGDA